MRAILEIEVPESCVVCRLRCNNDGYGDYCAVLSSNSQLNYDVGVFKHERDPNCPLKIIEKAKEGPALNEIQDAAFVYAERQGVVKKDESN